MARETVIAQKQVDFGGGGTATITIHPRDNNGKISEFFPGDIVYLRLYANPATLLSQDVDVFCSIGTVSVQGDPAVATFSGLEEDYDWDDDDVDGPQEWVMFADKYGRVSYCINTLDVPSSGYSVYGGTSNLNKTNIIVKEGDESREPGFVAVEYTSKYLSLQLTSIIGDYSVVDVAAALRFNAS